MITNAEQQTYSNILSNYYMIMMNKRQLEILRYAYLKILYNIYNRILLLLYTRSLKEQTKFVSNFRIKFFFLYIALGPRRNRTINKFRIQNIKQ